MYLCLLLKSPNTHLGSIAKAIVVQPVVQTMRRDSDALVELRVGSDTVRATPEHPFWVCGQGWKPAGELVGDALLR